MAVPKPNPKQARPLGVRIKDALAEGLIRGAARLPLPVLHRLGDGLGWLLRRWPNRQRRNALLNIALSLPELAPEEQRRLRDAALRALCQTYLEIGYLWLRPAEEVLGLVREVRGAEHLRRPSGQGLIVLSPHIGAWELAGLYLANQGPSAIFYKPQRYLDDLIRTARARGGAELAPISARGIRTLVQALERGAAVGILPDQEPRENKGSVFAPLFGIEALSMLLVRRLARRTGAPVIFLFAERLPEGDFRIHCQPAPAGIDSEDEREAAAALNRGIEQCVRTCPEQYLWPYKRYRRRPAGASRIYGGALDDHAALARATRLRAEPAQFAPPAPSP